MPKKTGHSSFCLWLTKSFRFTKIPVDLEIALILNLKYKSRGWRAGLAVQCTVALAEDPGLAPSTNIVANNHLLTSVLVDLMSFSGFSVHCTHAVHLNTSRQNIHTHKKIIQKNQKLKKEI